MGNYDTPSVVEISFDSASRVVTLVFDGNTDYPVQTSADAMMNDQGISEVCAKDNSIPPGINMNTLVNKKLLDGFIKFNGQTYRINSVGKLEFEFMVHCFTMIIHIHKISATNSMLF